MLINLIRALMSGGTEEAKQLLIIFLMWLPIIMLSYILFSIPERLRDGTTQISNSRLPSCYL